MSNNSFSRRDFLKTGALSSLALGSGFLGKKLTPAKKFKSAPGDARNVIFLVVDGMSSGTMALADLVKQQKYGDKTNWIKLYESDREYHRGLMDMASLDSVVTDSAAAASSWGCGHRINNGGLNWGPNYEQHKPICQIFKDAGKAAGLVTTARITHATPAGFGVNMPNRGMEDEIAQQYAEREYDVLMGGGNRHFDPSMRKYGKDLYSEFREKGYTVARTRNELKRAGRNSKLLGIFSDSHVPYSVDRNTLPELQETVPTLSEMTTSALERLDRKENGFILQIEGARVDHAAHGNDPAGLIYDQIAFDDVIAEVLNFTENREDTLVILTTDHGNANPGLSGMGYGYRESPKMLETIHDYRHSFEWMYSEFNRRQTESGNAPQVNLIKEVVEYATRVQITTDQALMIKRAFLGTFDAPFDNREGVGAVMAGVLANYNGIYFIGTNHTADYVELSAWGPGSDRIPTFVRNTALFDLMVEMADVRAYAEG